jgi:hypothetical protein
MVCSGCGGDFPPEKFRVWTTRAAAQALGYSGERRVEQRSSKCPACRPKRRPPSKMSNLELNTAVYHGDLPGWRRDAIVAARSARAKRRMKTGVANRWARDRAEPFRELIAAHVKEKALVHAQQVYAQRTGNAPVYAYAKVYYELLNARHAALVAQSKVGGKPPPSGGWSVDDRLTVFKAWARCTTRTRAPKLLNKLRGAIDDSDS